MPITINNVVGELDRTLMRTLNVNIDDQFYRLAVAEGSAFSLLRQGAFLTSIPKVGSRHPAGLFSITFDTAPMPTRQHLEVNDNVNIRRITLHFNGARNLLPPRTRTKFYFAQGQGSMNISSRRIAEKIVEVNNLYFQGMQKMVAKKEMESNDAKLRASSEEQMIERKKKLKATEAQRESMYEELQASLTGFGTVESELKSGYINLRLENNVRVKIAVDAERVFITEIDTPMYFDRARVKDILGYLQKVSAL